VDDGVVSYKNMLFFASENGCKNMYTQHFVEIATNFCVELAAGDGTFNSLEDFHAVMKDVYHYDFKVQARQLFFKLIKARANGTMEEVTLEDAFVEAPMPRGRRSEAPMEEETLEDALVEVPMPRGRRSEVAITPRRPSRALPPTAPRDIDVLLSIQENLVGFRSEYRAPCQ
jgi:hypothetical protein